jgi:creatinine amidohydrolase
MRLQDLNWMDVEGYLERDNRIMLVTGATEQHGYLSLLTAAMIPSRIALAAAERAGVLVAPSLNFGVSDLFADFPGTISLSQQTFDSVLVEVVEGLMHQGFTGFFVLNGHDGNKLPARLNDLHNEGSLRICWHDWWRGEAARAVEAQYGLRFDHANWGENFRFNRVTETPKVAKPEVNLAYADEGTAMRVLIGDGSLGGPYQVEDLIMETLFEQAVGEVVDLLARL